MQLDIVVNGDTVWSRKSDTGHFTITREDAALLSYLAIVDCDVLINVG